MRPKSTIRLAARTVAAIVIFCAIRPVGAAGETVLSDEEKLQIVYQMYTRGKKDFPQVQDLSPRDVMQLMKTGRLVLVDTRRPAEMKISMLPGAIPKNEYLIEPNRYKDLTVVTYCTVSYRSGVFARQMKEKGFTVINMKGGILAWTLEGGSIYDANGRRTKQIHVFGKRWNYAPQGYEVTMFSLWEQIF